MKKSGDVKNTFLMCLVIFFAVLLGNFINIAITNPDPLITRSGMAHYRKTILGEYNGIEVNDGAITQSLGVASANQLLKGQLPLWNHYEGVGAPLAGDMQPAALFVPFNLLLKLPNGYLIFRVVLETFAGIGMFLFLRRLKISQKFAVIGGVLFALNGCFAVLGSAVFAPIAFLPWLMLSIEMMFDSIKEKKRWFNGVALFAVMLAYSIYAGFPETAYLNGLLVFAWAIFRLYKFKGQKDLMIKFSWRLILAGVLGLMLSAPIIYLFAQYLMNGANIGGHSGNFSSMGVVGESIPMFFFPFVYGLIFQNIEYTFKVWSGLGGFWAFSTLVLAMLGVLNKKLHKSIKIFFWAVIIITFLRTIGFPVVTHILDMLPLMKAAAVHRYIPPITIFALIVMAAAGAEFVIEQFKQGNARDRRIIKIMMMGLVVIALTLLTVARMFIKKEFINTSGVNKYFIISCIVAVIFIGLLILLIKSKKNSHYIAILIVILGLLEPIGLFLIPQLGAPIRHKAVVDTGVVDFLRKNIDEHRFYYIGGNSGFKTNYGSYYGIAGINTENLPTPQLWEDFVAKNLDNNTSTISFGGGFRKDWAKNSVQQEFFRNLQNYKSIGVKYVVSEIASQFAVDPELAKKYGLKKVYSNDKTNTVIYEMDGAKRYASANDCNVQVISKNDIIADCVRDSVLIRRELFFDGWTAKNNDENIEISKVEDIFQGVMVNKGKNLIKFNFWPKYLSLSIAVFFVAANVILGGLVFTYYKRNK